MFHTGRIHRIRGHSDILPNARHCWLKAYIWGKAPISELSLRAYLCVHPSGESSR
jgi:hypothetical protein